MYKIFFIIVCLSIASPVIAKDTCYDYNDYYYKLCISDFYKRLIEPPTDISKEDYCKYWAAGEVEKCISRCKRDLAIKEGE